MNYYQLTKEKRNVVHRWGRQTTFQFRRSILKKTKSRRKLIKAKQIKAEKKAGRRLSLVNSLTSKVNYDVALNPNNVAFGMPPHGIFLMLGAGKGHPHKSKPRKYVDWVNPVLDKQIPQLADNLTKLDANFALKYFRIENKLIK